MWKVESQPRPPTHFRGNNKDLNKKYDINNSDSNLPIKGVRGHK